MSSRNGSSAMREEALRSVVGLHVLHPPPKGISASERAAVRTEFHAPVGEQCQRLRPHFAAGCCRPVYSSTRRIIAKFHDGTPAKAVIRFRRRTRGRSRSTLRVEVGYAVPWRIRGARNQPLQNVVSLVPVCADRSPTTIPPPFEQAARPAQRQRLAFENPVSSDCCPKRPSPRRACPAYGSTRATPP